MAASVIMTIVGIAAAASSKILAEEFKAWRPCLTKKLVALAVSRLPESKRERYNEEWSSYLEETPGEIGKMLAALGLVWAGSRIGRALQKETRTANALAGKSASRRLRDALKKALLVVWTAQPFAEFAALLLFVTLIILSRPLHHEVQIPPILRSIITALATVSLLFMRSNFIRAKMSIRKLIETSKTWLTTERR
jgi:hypothetical protein